jgi:peptide/nickel transport system substrate-binding protein
MAQKGESTGQMTWAMHITLAPTWFDPAETGALITPYICLYALHDALVKPMPDGQMSPCLATRWRENEDGLSYDFELRQGVTFHNGDPFTAEDVAFSFARYKGAGATELKKQVKAIEILNPHHIRFVLHAPWPDFLTFYATPATGAGWIVPKNYTEKIGNDAFKNQPVGLGPYRFVSYKPGIELVLEAYTDYWRKTPFVKRKVQPRERAAMQAAQREKKVKNLTRMGSCETPESNKSVARYAHRLGAKTAVGRARTAQRRQSHACEPGGLWSRCCRSMCAVYARMCARDPSCSR